LDAARLMRTVVACTLPSAAVTVRVMTVVAPAARATWWPDASVSASVAGSMLRLAPASTARALTVVSATLWATDTL
jgi:hypothetical protein